jgi:hypothetical protein
MPARGVTGIPEPQGEGRCVEALAELSEFRQDLFA